MYFGNRRDTYCVNSVTNKQKTMYNHDTECLMFCCTHTTYLKLVEKLWVALSLFLIIIIGIFTLDNIYDIISWEVCLLMFYIYVGAFIALCMIKFICYLAEKRRRKKYSEAEANAEEKLQAYVIEVSESSEIIKDMESKCQDLKGFKSKPCIHPQVLAIPREIRKFRNYQRYGIEMPGFKRIQIKTLYFSSGVGHSKRNQKVQKLSKIWNRNARI